MIKLIEHEHSLEIQLTDEGKRFVLDIDLLNFHGLFEDIEGNSEYEYCSDCSIHGHLSNAPIIHISDYDDDGDVIEHRKLWYYDNYCIDNFVEILCTEGQVFFLEHR